jgi:Sulfatase
VAYNDHFYRQRLRALQAVDELVEGIVLRLDEHGILENTIIIYSADNGYHIGQHRLQPGKECGYEEDINIPLIIRGPGIAKNWTTDLVTTHTDLAPTILSLVGEAPRPDFDGIAIPVSQDDIIAAKSSGSRYEQVAVEYWGFAVGEGRYDNSVHFNNTYKAIRVIGQGYNLYYSVWCHNERELYDLQRDPHQLENLLGERSLPAEEAQSLLLGLPIEKIASRLDSLLFVLKSCKGERCVRPWEALHPSGDVSTLKQALSGRFDDFYEREQPRVAYSRCELGYILDAEGPQFETDGLVYRDGVRWSEWV